MEEVIAEKSTSYIITMTLCCLICLGAVIFLIFAYGGINAVYHRSDKGGGAWEYRKKTRCGSRRR